MISKVETVIKRVDLQLYKHLENENVMFVQFAFRWINCLLLRELKIGTSVRLFDSYLAEEKHVIKDFHVFVCSALLLLYSKDLLSFDFQKIFEFLQDLPSQKWASKDLSELLGEAFVLKTLFEQSPNHLKC